jgi:hypothetical protein
VKVSTESVASRVKSLSAQTVFEPRARRMGTFKQPQGDLTGWVITKDTLGSNRVYT